MRFPETICYVTNFHRITKNDFYEIFLAESANLSTLDQCPDDRKVLW